MTEFTLDTSGHVLGPPNKHGDLEVSVFHRFAELDSVTQGYVRAAFAGPATWTEGRCLTVLHEWAGFSDLHPDTLAGMIRDCAHVQESSNPPPYPNTEHGGAVFWDRRQRGVASPTYPPLTLSLDDAGKVVAK